MANKRAIFGAIPWSPKRLGKDIYRYNFFLKFLLLICCSDKILVSAVEHKSINENVVQQLVNRGYEVIKLPVDRYCVDEIFLFVAHSNREGRIIIEDMVRVLQQNHQQVFLFLRQISFHLFFFFLIYDADDSDACILTYLGSFGIDSCSE